MSREEDPHERTPRQAGTSGVRAAQRSKASYVDDRVDKALSRVNTARGAGGSSAGKSPRATPRTPRIHNWGTTKPDRRSKTAEPGPGRDGWTSAEVMRLNQELGNRRDAAPGSQRGFYAHPSHAGTAFRRKPRKRKKRVQRTAVYDPLAPVFVPGGPQGTVLDVVHDYVDDGQGGVVDPSDYDPNYQESLRDVPLERGSTGRKPIGNVDDLDFDGEWYLDEDGNRWWKWDESGTQQIFYADWLAGQKGKPRKKSTKAERSMMSQLSVASLAKSKGLMDYDKLAQLDEEQHKEQLKLKEEEEDPWKLRYPENDEDDPNLIKPLSYKKVQVHKYDNHPRDRHNKEEFKWWCDADISYIPFFCDPLVDQEEWVTPVAREIGLGPTLFLMTLRAFMWLFLFFTIINIPLMIFYASGNMQANEAGAVSAEGDQNAVDQQEAAGAKSSSPVGVFAMLSIGNIGVSDYTCANLNIGHNKRQLIFSCPYGAMKELTSYGLQKQHNSTCKTESGLFYIGERPEDKYYDKIYDLQYDCTKETGLTPEGLSNLTARFDSACTGQPYCELEIMYSWFNWDCRNRINYYAAASDYSDYADAMGWTYHLADPRIREPILFGVALCVADQLVNPFSGEVMGIDKASFTYFLIGYDLLIILVSVMFINLLHVRYEQYAAMYDKRTVEMADFALRIRNLPYDCEFGQKDTLLQCVLWNHIEHCVRAAMIEDAEANEDQEAHAALMENRLWEICDITFCQNDMSEPDLLIEMDDFDRKKKLLIHEAEQKVAENEGVDLTSLNKEIIDLIVQYKERKAQYIAIQEGKLYNKWEITPDNEHTPDDQGIPIAFVVFRSMRGKQKCLDLFSAAESNYSKSKTKKAQEKYGAIMLCGRYLEVQETCSPNSLLYQHLRYTTGDRIVRSIIIWLVAIILVVLAFLLMVWFKNYNQALADQASPNMKCPSVAIEVGTALEDAERPPALRQNLLGCFCLNVYEQNDKDVSSALAEFQAVDPETSDNPCDDWKDAYENSFVMLIISGAMISVVNAICVFIFEVIVFFEKCSTLENETLQQFTRIVIIQFLNIAAVLLFADFTLGQTEEDMGGVQILLGRFRDFDTDWFYQVGVQITIAMIGNSLSPYFAKLFTPLIPIALRFYDRGFKPHLLKRNNIKEELAEAEEHDAQLSLKPSGRPVAEAEGEEEEEAEEAEGGSEEYNQRERSRIQEQPGIFQTQALEGGDDFEEPQDSMDQAETVEKTPRHKRAPQEDAEYEVGPDEPQTASIFQDDLNALYMGEAAQVFYLYSWFFTNLLVYYTFSGAMPLMYPLGCLHFFLGYLAYKYLFIRLWQRTQGFDQAIPLFSVHLMKCALFVHLLMILFIYTNKRLLSPEGYDVFEHYRPSQEPPTDFFARRFNTSPTLSVLLYFCALLLVYCIYFFIILPISRCKSEARRKPPTDEQLRARPDHSDDIWREMRIRALKSHYIRAHKEFQMFRTMLNAISYDQELLPDCEAVRFKKQLKARIQSIEERIDLHLDLIMALQVCVEKTYMYKLDFLIANEEKLKMKDLTLQRIHDRQQSYYIYDSEKYSKPGIILNRIDQEILELGFLAKETPVYC